ncbi:hypothetical protein N9544_04225 [Flavobacteriales bacterium]|nr:hypothetical protein [Flavobacteriales bacterium]
MNIESTHTEIKNSPEKIYNYLMDLNNVKELLPEGKYTEWEGEYDSCSFKMMGFGLTLKKESSTPHSEIKLVSGEDSPIDFDLNISINDLGNGSCDTFLNCEARVNAFLKMMIEKPLTNLFNHMSEKLERVDLSK